MSLAQRVRDIRYAKGWGPDELANRAEISRTALYQIESGKTGLPRAGTLRRIAVALEVPMEDLLGIRGTRSSRSVLTRSGRRCVVPAVFTTGYPLKGGRCRFPMAPASSRSRSRRSKNRDSRSTPEIPAKSNGHEAIYLARGRVDVQAARLASFSDRQRRRANPGGASRYASPVPFFDLIDGFDTRSRFIG